MRARYPDTQGTVTRNGGTIAYDVYENDGPTILLCPTWQIIDSRHWKFQIPFLARHFRVVVFDAIGSGKSSGPLDDARYRAIEDTADAIAVLDATNTDTCVAVGLSMGGGRALTLAAQYPNRVNGVVAISAAHPWASPPKDREDGLDTAVPIDGKATGWAKDDPDYYRSEWQDFAEFFLDQVWSDPRSTKGWDDAVDWALDNTGEIVALSETAPASLDIEQLEAQFRTLPMPVLLIHGTADQIIAARSSEVMHEMLPDSELHLMDGAGHIPNGRYPVRVNQAIKGFVNRIHGLTDPSANWHRGNGRPKTALYVSSPIGLGHARRDVAIADELRALDPDLKIDWLAQDPVTRVLDAAGEHIHPASAYLANESAHIEDECGEHSLAAFQAIRNMDEILLTNFMVFDEITSTGQYDLVIGDEAWEVDHHLHENPGLKKTAYAWMTDFVGFLPVASGGTREAFVTADYNAEMIEQVARYARVRDKAVFVGHPEDIVDQRFGPKLPLIREWTEDNFEFSGYVSGFDPAALGDRAELRHELGYRPDDQLCIVSVGGTAVGIDLLRRVVEAIPAAAKEVPNLKMVIVTGPRIDPSSLPQIPGVEYKAYVDRLYRHLAVADLAIVQGGLTTTMELTAAKVPFIYVPLRDHFEQNFHVRARLDRYKAGRLMNFEDVNPDHLAQVMAEEIGKQVGYRDVEVDGAKRAASLIYDLL